MKKEARRRGKRERGREREREAVISLFVTSRSAVRPTRRVVDERQLWVSSIDSVVAYVRGWW